MIDLLHAIHACGELIDYWDVGRRQDGIVVHLRSRERWASKSAALEAAGLIAERARSAGCDVIRVEPTARSNGTAGWHGFAELVVE